MRTLVWPVVSGWLVVMAASGAPPGGGVELGGGEVFDGQRAGAGELARAALVKQFCVAMRRNPGDGGAAALVEGVDPALSVGRVATLPVMGIHDLQVAADGETVVALVSLAEGGREVLVFRTVEREGAVYLAAVAGEGGVWTAWTLRMTVGGRT